ncbi:hypothetical protein GM418_29765 [Maribellus comscasis]|uniref:Uncharacterized protein n=1 Tax=Maribellus comscasis TaxID=2681766 RepID=A0A6I6K5G5_9BACT|nr:hypothetical protein GM418_29765 [Maribellus comscasis]
MELKYKIGLRRKQYYNTISNTNIGFRNKKWKDSERSISRRKSKNRN